MFYTILSADPVGRGGVEADYNPSSWELTKRLLGYMRPFLHIFAAILATALGRQALFSLVSPLLVMLIIDYVLVPVSPGQTNWFLELLKGWTGVSDGIGLLVVLCSLIVVLAVVRGAFAVVHITMRATLSQRILRVMRRDFYRSLINKSFSYLDRVLTGQIISRITSDMGAIDLFYAETVREIFRHGMQFLLTIYILLQFDVSLTAICCVPLPFIFLTTRLYSSGVRPHLRRSKNRFGALNSVLVEGIVAHKLIKAFGQEEVFLERFNVENREYLGATLKASSIQALYRPSSSAMVAVGVALIIVYGGLRVLRGSLTIGEMILFATYFTQLVGPMRMFARLIEFYQDAIASARRVFEIMDLGADVPEAENPIELPRLRGAIEFENVSFAYEGTEETLRDVSLSIRPGEKVALMGFVGSGKTTLAELVPRFYDVSKGRVLVDGYDVRDVSLRSLRSQIGIVLQDVFVFSMTVRENIAFGKPDATDEEIIRVAKAAQIHDFIESLPMGYDTVVGERGLTLSGGQRQRITIARTLLTDPAILILDDSTSNVDAETEVLIRKAIDALLEGRTALIITQRASTCEAADRVVVMDGGRIAAVGKHGDLLASSEIYRRLIESQALVLGQEAEG
ncbi:ABC transporter ATP-binding protein [Candidatus Bathyarchaeota archaeon]|nr:MAG: ABC transporter ATP-binding protein [Candidatus Bathyarchaeota archaeon]